jgi:serpin B
MRNGRWAAAGLGLAAVVVAGCGSMPAVRPPAPVITRGVAVSQPAADPRPYGAADTAFGLDALGAWCRADPRANLVMSPSSLTSGLGMAYLGARGRTARAMAGVLHLPAASGPALEAGLRARSAGLRGLDRPGLTVASSDQVWADPRLPPVPSYLNAVATAYGAGLAQVPLLSQPDRAAQEINQAIAGTTRGQIPHLLAPGSLKGISWVLTDALYLNAAWATPFPPSQTSPGPFTTAGGQPVSAQFMHGDDYRRATASGWTAVSLPYRGGQLAMTALLPAVGAVGCAMPTAAALAAITARLAAAGPPGPNRDLSRTAVVLPRVNLSTHGDLMSLLTRLGMGIAFTRSADFTGLSPWACCIGLVEHAATLRVGEKGTVASAATAVGIAATAGLAPTGPVVFDRPFLLLVTDTATGEPLFLARVANPAVR